jgi:hypothetical protein
MSAVRTLECDLKPKSTLCRAERTLRCDLKTEVDFRLPCETDLDATTVVDFAPHGVDLRCKKRKALSGKPKRMKNQRKRIVLPPERA